MFINAHDEVLPEFAAAMVRLASAYQNARLTDIGIRVYARALNDCSLAAVLSACGRAVQECRYFPTVAELRAFITPSTDDAALIAWSALGRAASRVGAYQSLVFEDHAAAYALMSVFGSWPAYCDLESGVIGSRKAEFMAAYREGRRQVRHEGRGTRVMGLCEASGKYHNHGACWAGLIQRDGTVCPAREDALLEPVADRRAIGDGTIS